ncbi:MAG TPA: ABC transporter permease [Gemmatimonadaceae bacterium]|jgi:putative ABC transport system permease protein|nr:ABC transporter permease [Gemmatimonadaceae bacterium]
MLFGEIISVALGALRANKLRSVLTMLGIVIGVAAVIAMIALGNGAQKAVRDRISALGTTLLTVMPGQAWGMGGVRSGDAQRMTMDDARAIEERAAHIIAVQPEMQRQLQIQYNNRNANTSIVGTTANYLEVRKYELEAGKMFTPGHDAARARVAVVGPAVAQLLGFDNPIALVGQNVRIRGIQFEVIGVLKSKGQGGGFGNPDEQVLIPLNTARFRVIGSDRLRSINVLAASEAEIPLAMAEIQKVLRREHRLRPGREDDFNIRNQSDFLNTLGETTAVFGLLLAGIATVSLVVGGIGIMNIMLVSVTERTREIGVRKALGATRFNILSQFLIEAIVLCILGGIVGILVGSGTAYVLQRSFQWSTEISTSAVVMAFLFSAAVGVVFGVWPARRAASLDPIQALRYE